MRRPVIVLLLGLATVALATAKTATAAGFQTSANFIVFTPAEASPDLAQQFAQQVMERAEAHRAQVSEEWFGQAIPDGVGRTVISVTHAEGQDRGMTWAIDSPDRTMHNIYLTLSPGAAIGPTLDHEIAHIVLATWRPHPNRLPAWLEEGIASGYDDAERKAARAGVLRWAERSSNWPQLADLLRQPAIGSQEQSAYAAAASLTQYLLSRGNKQTLLQFARDGQQQGWNKALSTHYHITDTSALQSAWQAWVVTSARVASRP